jgi:hypothetical protein
MPSWLLPAVKLILPHVGTIITAAKPAFTKRRGEEAAPAAGEQDNGIVQQQIAELQSAVSQNATHIKELAEQLRITVAAIEQAAAAAEQRVRRLYLVAGGSLVLALVALVVALAA